MVQLGLETKSTLLSSMLRMTKETFKLSHVHRHWGFPAGTDGCCLLFSELGGSRYRSRDGTLNPLPISQLLLGAGGDEFGKQEVRMMIPHRHRCDTRLWHSNQQRDKPIPRTQQLLEDGEVSLTLPSSPLGDTRSWSGTCDRDHCHQRHNCV